MTKITFDFEGNDERNIDNIAVSSKTERQELAVEKWRRAGGKGIIHATARFGKTRIALTIINKIVNRNPVANILIVVPNAYLIKQWQNEIEAYEQVNRVSLRNKISLLTRQQWINFKDIIRTLIVFDEVHKYITTPENREVYLETNSKFMLGLTATIDNESYVTELMPIVDTITEQEAIANNWINNYEEFNLALPTDSTFRSLYLKYSDHITETITLFSGIANMINAADIEDNVYFGFASDYAVIMACLSGAKDRMSGDWIYAGNIRQLVSNIKGWSTTLNLKDNYEKSIEEYWSPNAVQNRTRTFTNFVRERKTLIDTYRIKYEALLKLVTSSTDETLIYVGTIDFAEELRESINSIMGNDKAICFHSKVASRPIIDTNTGDYFEYKSGAKKGLPKIFGMKKLKEHYIDGLKGGVYNILITVESLNEGLDVPNLKRVIVASGSRNAITQKQRTARVKTIDEMDLDKNAVVINLYFDNFMKRGETVYSVDKAKLLKRQKTTEKTPVYLDFEDYMLNLDIPKP